MRFFDPSGWKEITRAIFYTGTKWANITRGIFYNGTDWVEIGKFTDPLTLSNSPSTVSGIIFTNSTQGVRTSQTTATPSGGLRPFTYQYSLVSHDGPTPPAPETPTMARTAFIQGNVGPGEFYQATFRCVVTDSIGQTAQSTIQATFTNTGGIGPL